MTVLMMAVAALLALSTGLLYIPLRWRPRQRVSAVYPPHTDHASDVFGASWSPAARTGTHVLERFLAVMASSEPDELEDRGNGAREVPRWR